MIYSPIHKGIRSRLFRVASDAGRVGFHDSEAVKKFQQDFAALVHNIVRHHELEDQFLHPLLAGKVPGGAEELEEDHRVAAHMMENLVKHLEGITALPSDYSKLPEAGLEFYLAYNRFIIFFMEHLNEEEQHIQPALWAMCETEEIITAVATLQANQEPGLAMENIEMIITSVSLDELTEILVQSRPNVPAQAFQGAMAIAERNLSPQDYTRLASDVSA
jgi:hemerythrin-like domain-containing protein